MASNPPSKARQIPGGIRIQVLVPAVLLLLGAMWLIALATLQVTRRALEQQAEERALSHASVLLEELAKAPPDEITPKLITHVQSAGLDYAAWTTTDGELISSHQGDLQELALMYIASQPPHKMSSKTLTHADTQLLFTSLRGQQGTVIVAMDMRSVRESLALARQSSLLFMILNVTLLLALGYAVFTYLVVRPLKTIGGATERASQGDFASPITLVPGNEFGRLARQFNLMLTQLTEQRQRLLEQVEELARTNDTLLSTQQSLIRSEKLASVGQLAAGVAHEVGNPLAAVSGYAELISDGDLDVEEAAHLAGRITRQVERMQKIIRELLDYSRNDDDEFVVRPFDLTECVEEALELAHTTGQLKHVDVEQRLPEDLPEVMGNPSQTLQVLLNLVINASDALQKTPSACYRLDAEITDEHVILYVEDNGPGIPDEVASKIFDPFFTTKAPGQGTGLGLAISLRIMNRMHGDLELVAPRHVDSGACFKLTFRRAGA